MALINLRSILYFAPRRQAADIVEAFTTSLPAIGEAVNVAFLPFDDADAAILSGDRATLVDSGQQFFVTYDGDSLLRVSLSDSGEGASSVSFLPELIEADRVLTNRTWTWLIGLTKVLITQLTPTLAQINGVDENKGRQVVPAKTVRRGSLPEFLTPFTYIVDPAATELARRARNAGVEPVERLASGWAMQFVADLYHRPGDAVLHAMASAYGVEKAPYLQTDVYPE